MSAEEVAFIFGAGFFSGLAAALIAVCVFLLGWA